VTDIIFNVVMSVTNTLNGMAIEPMRALNFETLATEPDQAVGVWISNILVIEILKQFYITICLLPGYIGMDH